MVSFIERGAKTQHERRKAERTAKSYVLQEAEAASRNAKTEWCRNNGLGVEDLQHDGIVVVGVEGRYGGGEGASRGGDGAGGVEGVWVRSRSGGLGVLGDGYPTQEEESRAGKHAAELGRVDDVPVPLVRGHVTGGEEGEEMI